MLRIPGLMLGGVRRGALRSFCTKSGSSSSAEIWDWVPPSSQRKNVESKDNYVIPTLPGVMLTPEEVRKSLESQGGENTVVFDINGNFGEFKQMVISSGRSLRHIRKMTTSIIAAMKDRRLKHHGIEGEADDDWQCINCNYFLVHVLLPKTRKHLDIEGHWTSPTRPELLLHSSHPGYEAHFQQLLEQYPCPEDYNADTDVAYKDDPVVKEL